MDGEKRNKEEYCTDGVEKIGGNMVIVVDSTEAFFYRSKKRQLIKCTFEKRRKNDVVGYKCKVLL